MGTVAARSVKRPRWRAYLLLSRISNLPTVWTNVLAGIVAAHAPVQWSLVARVAAGVSLLYTAGMFLNDAFDRHIDAVERPDRPIPAGDVTARAAFASGYMMLAAGVWVVSMQPRFVAPLVWSLLLAAAIVRYNYHHKKNPLGPLMMGLCRGLVYCVAASAAAIAVPWHVLAAALCLIAYVVGLTEVAKRTGPRAGVVVPLLIAGISLFDAGVVALSGGGIALAALAAAGFPATLMLQRVVPGT
jgi:4-hydroxybenzoate polyprenyltransferase